MKGMMKYVKWVYRVSGNIRLPLFASALSALLHTVVSLFFVYACKELIDMATGNSDGNMALYSFFLFASVILQLVFSSLTYYLDGITEIRFRNNLRAGLFDRIANSCYAGRSGRHTGDLVNRLEEDVRVVSDALCNIFPSLVATTVNLLAAFLFLLVLDSRLAWSVVFIMPVCLLVGKLFVGRMKDITKEIRDTDGNLQSHIQESLQNLTLLQVMEHIPYAGRKLESLQDSLYRNVGKRLRYGVVSKNMITIAFAASYITAFLWGVNGIMAGTVTFGMMTAFLQLVGQIQRPMLEISRKIPALVHASASVDRISDMESIEREKDCALTRLPSPAGVELSGVDFVYADGSEPVLKDFSHDFKPGSRTAVLGVTGAGKSTLFKLILGLVSPDKGSVRIYSGDRSVNVSSGTRCNFVYVPQGNSLMSGTIRQNLLLGDPDATQEQMLYALSVAEAGFVSDFPLGLDTRCGEGGGGLSEGQAQRIAIARALLRKGSVLLFDEFSSSLDTETEDRLIRNLLGMPGERTMIFITHRSRIADFCSSVVRIDRLS